MLQNNNKIKNTIKSYNKIEDASSVFAAMPPATPSSLIKTLSSMRTVIKEMPEMSNSNFDAPFAVFCAYLLHLLALNLLGYTLFPNAYAKFVPPNSVTLPCFLLYFLPYYLLTYLPGIDFLDENIVLGIDEKFTPERSHIAFLIKLLRLLRVSCYLGTTLFCFGFSVAILSGHFALIPPNLMAQFGQNNLNGTHFHGQNATDEPIGNDEQCVDYSLELLYAINFFGAQQIDFWWYLLCLFVMRWHMLQQKNELLIVAIFILFLTSIFGLTPGIFTLVYEHLYCQ